MLWVLPAQPGREPRFWEGRRGAERVWAPCPCLSCGGRQGGAVSRTGSSRGGAGSEQTSLFYGCFFKVGLMGTGSVQKLSCVWTGRRWECHLAAFGLYFHIFILAEVYRFHVASPWCHSSHTKFSMCIVPSLFKFLHVMHMEMLKRTNCILVVDVFQFKFHLRDRSPHFATLEAIVYTNVYV